MEISPKTANFLKKLDSLRKAFFKGRESRRASSPLSRRAARVEPLESRELLSVTTGEYASIRAAYSEFALPASMSAINIIEIGSDAISLDSLNAALDRAGSTKGNDLIVVRTTGTSNRVELTGASDEIKFELDPDVFGSVALVSLGSSSLTIDANGATRALSVASGNLSLGGIELVDGLTSDSGAVVYNKATLTMKNCVVSGGVCGATGQGSLLYSTGTFTGIDVEFVGGSRGGSLVASGSFHLSDCSVDGSSGNGVVLLEGADSELTNCSITNNAGTGLTNLGSVVLTGCSITGNGASGVVNRGVGATLTATRDVIRGNVGTSGAGLLNLGGSATIKNSEISANAATERGGGVDCENDGESNSRTTLVNCTIAGNVGALSGGGVFIAESSNCFVYNTIISENLTNQGAGTNIFGDYSNKNSFVGNNPEFVVAPVFDYSLARLTNADSLDLRLTKKSAALNVGDKARVEDGELDLAGNPRLYGPNVDVGAYEYQGTGESAPTRSLVVTTLADSFNPSDGATSLREAIYWATPSNSTISFDAALTGTIKLTSQLTIDSDVIINGDGRITLDAQGKSRVALVEGIVDLNSLTLTNGSTAESGGILYNGGDLALSSCVVSEGSCGTKAFGGLVYSTGILLASDTTFTHSLVGDALYVEGATTLNDCVVSNAAQNGVYSTYRFNATGGEISSNASNGVRNDGGDVALTNASVSSNKKSGLLNFGSAELIGVVFTSNGSSGAVNESALLGDDRSFSSTLTASRCAFRNNRGTLGAGLRNLSGRVEADNCEFSGNSATNSGGAVYSQTGEGFENTTILTNCTVAGNFAERQGGGVCVDSQSFLLFLHNTIVSMNNTNGIDANVSGEVSSDDGSFIGGNPGFVVAPLFNYKTGKISNSSALDLRLTANSVALDSGSSSRVESEVDLTGAPRVYGANVDPGAYEYQGTGERSSESVYLVTTLADTFNLKDGATSLREALYWANDGGGTIEFAKGLEGTIALTAQLVASCDVAIDGDGRITLDAQNNSRVIFAEGALTLNNMALVNGTDSNGGGAIYAQGSLAFENCSVSVCSSGADGGAIFASSKFVATGTSIVDSVVGGGIDARGELSLIDCAVSNNAGFGARVYGFARVESSTFSGNGGDGIEVEYGSVELIDVSLTSNAGAGLRNLGVATLSACRVRDNKGSGLVNRSSSGSSVYSSTLLVSNSFICGNSTQDQGGGVFNDGSTFEAFNSEISGNSAVGSGGGVYCAQKDGAANKTTLTNCTVAGNASRAQGGGVFVSSGSFVFRAYNTIVAKNYSVQTNANVEGPVAENIRCIFGGAPGFIVDPVFTESGAVSNADEFDLRLQSTSVAIDAGANDRAVGKFDLIGAPREFNGTVDIGAYEYCPALATRVTTLEDSFNLNDDVLSLREALYLATDGSLVTFDASLVGTIYLTSTLKTTGRVALIGSGDVALSGLAASPIIENKGELRASNLVFVDAVGSEFGGAICNTGALELESCVFKNCSAELGGAIYNGSSATLTVEDSRFVSNASNGSGGAIYNVGSFVGENCVFSSNVSGESGGTIYNAGSATFVDCLLVENVATKFGGAAFNATGFLSLANATVANNSASQGGGVCVDSGTVKCYNSVVATNAASSGPDLYKSSGTASASNTISSYAFGGSSNILYDGTQILFASASTGDYRLAPGSVAIDAGVDAFARQAGLGLFVGDLDGNARFLGECVDIGAYESGSIVDVAVGTGCSFLLEENAAAGDKVYWDLSGTGSGQYVETSSAFWTTSTELGLAPGLYALRSKVVDAAGKTKSTRSIEVQIQETAPSVHVESIATPCDAAVAYAITAQLNAFAPGRTWRVDWGDGSFYMADSLESFVAGKIYATNESATYVVRLALVGADGNDELSYEIGSIFVEGAEPASNELDESEPFENSFDDFFADDSAVDALASALCERETTSIKKRALQLIVE